MSHCILAGAGNARWAVVIHLALMFISLLLSPSAANVMNVTIDDYYGDPTNGQQIHYFPLTAWQRGDGCKSCTAKPTPATDAWLGTWHDATFNPNNTLTNSALGQILVASAQFTGTAVYVNCILTRSFTSPNGNTDMTFFLDNAKSGIFQLSPNGDASYTFDVPVFSATGLPFAQHTVRLEVGHAGQKALVLLDSIVYTTDDGLGDASSTISGSATEVSGTSSQSNIIKKTNVGVIVGPIVAAMALIIGLVIVAVLCLRRRRDRAYRRAERGDPSAIDPFEQYSQVTSPADTSTDQESSLVSSLVSISEDSGSIVVRVGKSPKEKPRTQGIIGTATENHHRRPLPRIAEELSRTAPYRAPNTSFTGARP